MRQILWRISFLGFVPSLSRPRPSVQDADAAQQRDKQYQARIRALLVREVAMARDLRLLRQQQASSDPTGPTATAPGSALHGGGDEFSDSGDDDDGPDGAATGQPVLHDPKVSRSARGGLRDDGQGVTPPTAPLVERHRHSSPRQSSATEVCASQI